MPNYKKYIKETEGQFKKRMSKTGKARTAANKKAKAASKKKSKRGMRYA
tara:strand:- start:20 stop:166 length:147 start_codon:yes stop_codon:yes gene_type:complete